MSIILEALKNSILITGLVMVMMLLIEYVNIRSHGESFKKLRKSPARQVVLAALLGLVPGCIGGFAVVSLFTHNLVSFGALVAMMIASSGDEAFIMLALIPKTAILLFVILFVIGIAAGIAVDKFYKGGKRPFKAEEFKLHDECCPDAHSHTEHHQEKSLKRSWTRERIIIMAGIAIFIVAVIAGILEHDHSAHAHEAAPAVTTEVHNHDHSEEIHNHQEDIHNHQTFDVFSERWMNLLFAGVSIFLLFLTARAGDHFIKEHLWGHVIKKHFRSIFLWTFGALLVIHYGMQFMDIQHWLKDNIFLMLLIAVLVGIIPESGPHMVFITLFAGGLIPFSVLLASSIAQDGHTALPLLAESKKGFVLAKAINIVIGLAVGVAVHLAGF
ncbi:MAG: putative manganese transporter [Bacteroidales bacterium]|jgi:hypothetical protein|nr:putative manganese transporter [Bacteroidales bacterium]MDD3273216.1 putative manganese transporter [Bacteroidales bacterium]MDD4058190.1 putative manganese transporter [Bacteroidales bacterium]